MGPGAFPAATLCSAHPGSRRNCFLPPPVFPPGSTFGCQVPGPQSCFLYPRPPNTWGCPQVRNPGLGASRGQRARIPVPVPAAACSLPVTGDSFPREPARSIFRQLLESTSRLQPEAASPELPLAARPSLRYHTARPGCQGPGLPGHWQSGSLRPPRTQPSSLTAGASRGRIPASHALQRTVHRQRKFQKPPPERRRVSELAPAPPPPEHTGI